jgi:ArsR family transcriptional regulator, lead/cadmium/zinc/bismuth-responsive transcriptional repressor
MTTPHAAPLFTHADGPLSADDVRELTEIFAALGDPTRVRIIYAILHTERSVGDLARWLGLSEPTVSQHLRRLRALRMVRLRQEGRHRFYRLDDDHVVTLLEVCQAHVQRG